MISAEFADTVNKGDEAPLAAEEGHTFGNGCCEAELVTAEEWQELVARYGSDGTFDVSLSFMSSMDLSDHHSSDGESKASIPDMAIPVWTPPVCEACVKEARRKVDERRQNFSNMRVRVHILKRGMPVPTVAEPSSRYRLIISCS